MIYENTLYFIYPFIIYFSNMIHESIFTIEIKLFIEVFQESINVKN